MKNTATKPLSLAVVGHTNTGKTSLLRTLTRNPRFGDVQDSPGTTRHVEAARLLVASQTIVELYDTPGLEDSMALLDYIDQQLAQGERLDGPDKVQRFLDSPESRRRFEQEARVLRTLAERDAALYVIDARDPVLAKHKDELELLSLCGRPLLPVLNFTHGPRERLDTWRDALARLGLHITVEFDTVAPALDGEVQLYDKLAVLMDKHAAALQVLKTDILEQRELRRRDAHKLIAEMLIDVAAYRVTAAPDNEALQQATAELRKCVREREQRCLQALLKRYNFDSGSFHADTLPLQGERWAMDLFHPQALKDMGIHLSKGMAAGAMAGATLDAFTAGISLGTATLLGAAAGGLWQGADKWGKRLYGRFRGFQELTVDDAVLRLLIVRQLALLAALERRGHAAQQPIVLAPDDNAPAVANAHDPGGENAADAPAGTADFRKQALPDVLASARAHPQWSALANDYMPSGQREQAVAELARRFTT